MTKGVSTVENQSGYIASAKKVPTPVYIIAAVVALVFAFKWAEERAWQAGYDAHVQSCMSGESTTTCRPVR